MSYGVYFYADGHRCFVARLPNQAGAEIIADRIARRNPGRECVVENQNGTEVYSSGIFPTTPEAISPVPG